MSTTERYEVNFFAIIVLVIIVILIVFLIVSAIYFFHMINNTPPTRGESIVLFWVDIVLGVILVMLAIYALFHLFIYPTIVYEEVPAPVQTPVYAPVQQQLIQRDVRMQPVEVNLSDIPVNRQQRVALNQELMSLGGAMNQ